MDEDRGDSRMPALLMQAAQSAAAADGLVPERGGNHNSSMGRPMPVQAPSNGGGAGAAGKKKGPPLRRGKWTPEEEAYANRLIQEFKAGLLPLTDGTTLRTFLSKLLNCDPMRISKKFVGSNCIGKQVFRRRTADLNRLTPEQIQQSRAELSELERRFLERVAQTNRVKSSGVGGASAPPPATMGNSNGLQGLGGLKQQHHQHHHHQDDSMQHGSGGGGGGNSHNNNNNNNDNHHDSAPAPWLLPPRNYKGHGTGAAFAAAHLSSSNPSAAAAGRALLGGGFGNNNKSDHHDGGGGNHGMSSHGSAEFLAMAELRRRASQQNMLQNALQQNSTSNLLAAAARSGSSNGLAAHLARTASAARMGLRGDTSMNNLMLKGLSREQLSQMARDRGLSSGSLSNMIQRQGSFDALMSLDLHSLQSIDNLANLIQTGGSQHHVPESGMKNADFSQMLAARASMRNFGRDASSSGMASANHVQSLLRNMSSGKLGRGGGGDSHLNHHPGNDSNASISNLLSSMGGSLNHFQGGGGGGNPSANASAASLLERSGSSASAVNLAHLLRNDSSTGLSALRMREGLNGRNSSVDDFLSLVATGDIPHQDASLLNVPLMHQQGGGGGGNGSSSSAEAAAKLLAHQQLLSSNPSLANALASRSMSNFSDSRGFGSSTSMAALQMAQARAQAAQGGGGSNKRSAEESGMDSQQHYQQQHKR